MPDDEKTLQCTCNPVECDMCMGIASILGKVRRAIGEPHAQVCMVSADRDMEKPTVKSGR